MQLNIPEIVALTAAQIAALSDDDLRNARALMKAATWHLLYATPPEALARVLGVPLPLSPTTNERRDAWLDSRRALEDEMRKRGLFAYQGHHAHY